MLGPEDVTTELITQQGIIELGVRYGVIPRAISLLFTLLQDASRCDIRSSLKCSYTEIYNESVNDLLSNPPAHNLRIREFPRLGMCILGATESIVSSPGDVARCLALGTLNRITGATEMNQRSSRSHTIFTLTLEQIYPTGSSKSAKLNLVDLAGSEKVSKTGATGKQLVEAQNINLSLTTLGRCIKALATSKEEHVPYRESKLTMILKEALGGNAKTSLICTASMRIFHVDESISTLQFAERAKKIQLKAHSNINLSPSELLLLVDKLKKEVKTLRNQLQSRDEGTPAPRDIPCEEINAIENTFAHILEEKHQFDLEFDRNSEDWNRKWQEMEGVRKENAYLKSVVERLNGEIKGKSEEIDQFQAQRRSMEAEIRSLGQELEEMKRNNASLTQENERLKEAYISTCKELEDARLSETHLLLLHQSLPTPARRQARRRNSKSLPNFSDLKSLIDDLKDQINQKQSQINEYSELNRTLKQDFAYKEAELQVKLTLAQAEIKSLTKAMCEFTGEEEKLDLKNINLKPVISKLMTEMTTFQSQYQTSVDYFKRELSLVKNDSKLKIEELEREIMEGNKRLEAEIGVNRELQGMGKVMEVELDSVNWKVKLMKEEIEKLRKEIEIRRNEEENWKMENGKLKAEMKEMREIRDLNEAILREKVEELEGELRQKECENRDLTDLLSEKDTELKRNAGMVYSIESKPAYPKGCRRPLSYSFPVVVEEGLGVVRSRGISIHDIKALYSNDEDSSEEDCFLSSTEELS